MVGKIKHHLKNWMRPKVVEWFHRIYYAKHDTGGTWKDTWWMGVQVQKNPFDLWIYQEILYKLKPDLIIETGTYNGGSTLYFASLLDLYGKGRIISIDIEPQENLPQHERITYIKDSSVSPAVIERLKEEVKGMETVLVILDSDHTEQHVLKELELYRHFPTLGSYMICEDTDINGHPVLTEYGPGPYEALEKWVPGQSDYVVDRSWEKHLMCFHKGGYLKRVK